MVCHPATRRSWHLPPPPAGGGKVIHVGLVPNGSRHFKLMRYFVADEDSIGPRLVLCSACYWVGVFSSQEEEWSRETWRSSKNVELNAGKLMSWLLGKMSRQKWALELVGTSLDIPTPKIASADLGRWVFLRGGASHWLWLDYLYILPSRGWKFHQHSIAKLTQ
ncbi:hypothetical protein ACLOJK_033923 [Asimina triloba]